MDAYSKIQQLKSIIIEKLTPLIDKDFYLLEVPNYTNIGDTLIWQGELDFFSTLPYKCKGMYSLETYPKWKKIPDGSLVLFQGGGNFGDLWTKHHNFKMNIVHKYPNCKFIFLPQTIWFKEEQNLLECAEFLSSIKNVTICARDSISFDILNKYFKCSTLLLPDMAFCINMTKWQNNLSGTKDLLLKRTDAEFKGSPYIEEVSSRPNVTITDWPTMLTEKDLQTKIMLKLKYNRYTRYTFADLYAYNIYRKHLIRTGVNLLSVHKKIYTTRLHTAILGVLMQKDIEFLDNSYGKNKAFYDTWLYDCANIKFIEND